ncbi:MAG: alpha-galactosidase [Verrucomicrobiota bacterium]
MRIENRFRAAVLLAIALCSNLHCLGAAPAASIQAAPDGGQGLWCYVCNADGTRYPVSPPTASIDGKDVVLDCADLQSSPPRVLSNGCIEQVFSGSVKQQSGLTLKIIFRSAADADPVIRFRYEISSATPRHLTKPAGRDALNYLKVSLARFPDVEELRLSEFNPQFHSYMPVERPLGERDFADRQTVMGPVLIGGNASHQVLLAYEHGSPAPDAFVAFALDPDRSVGLNAVKGNYWDGQDIGPDKPYSTLWLEMAVVKGGREDLARAYRDFVFRHLSLNFATRKPQVFYNTWNYQERLKAWKQKPYLSELSTPRLLAEIDAAHAMGIDVFVIDTGWYEKTGDWQPSRKRFPDGLKAVKARLDSYGMKLGLWFAPPSAALTSDMLNTHEDCAVIKDGKRGEPREVWETEKAINCCVVSRFGLDFADELIRLNRELGVTYFKWDAVEQYGCDAAGHGHGDASNSAAEREACYAFQMPLAMARIAERISAAVPDAICDFDMTENGRSFGLAFLAAGKYFLINNGPYYQNYDHPVPPDGNWNLFFRPGPARTWICRGPLTFDRWIPSTLFLTHYLPDDPAGNQLLCLGSLILGQDGIWGDLPSISPEGRERFGTVLGKYRQVRDDMAGAFPDTQGAVAGNPEVHEKIAANGRGAVVLFANDGWHRYVTTACPARSNWHTEGVQVDFDDAGHAIIQTSFPKPGAQIVFFGL